MAQCTAPVYGHRTESGRQNCPACGGRGRMRVGYMGFYGGTAAFPNNVFSKSESANHTPSRESMKKAKWSPTSSNIYYTTEQIRMLTPIRNSIVKEFASIDKYDLFLCHAWDDRRGIAKELYDRLIEKDVTVWFSEIDLPLGATMLREIDKGLAKSRAGIVLVTPAFLKRIEGEGVAEKELSALLAKDRLIPVVHDTTYEELRDVSPLLGSRNGLDTSEDSMNDIALKIAELFT